jgi:Prokaryotic E2 family E/Multiubiquitin
MGEIQMAANAGKQPEFIFDNEPQQWDKPTVTGKELRDKFGVPANVQIFQKVPGHQDREILDTTVVDLSGPGPERFSTQAVGSGAGLQAAARPLLLDEDYEELRRRGIDWEEDGDRRYLVFKDYALPGGIYVQTSANVLVQIPANYNHDGIDMLWVAPHLTRTDGKDVPAHAATGSTKNVHHAGMEFCRWSRHWNETYNRWRPGVDAIETILRRVRWALEHPDADRP